VLPRGYCDAGRRAELAGRWAARLSGASCSGQLRSAAEESLRKLIDRLLEAMTEDSALAGTAQQLGRRLAETSPEEDPGASLRVLCDLLLGEDPPRDLHRLATALSEVTTGYATAIRDRLAGELAETKRRADRSEARFSETFANTPVGIAVCDTSGAFLQVNPAWEETFGYPAEELAGKTIFDLCHPDDVADVSAAYRQLSGSEGAWQLPERKRLLRANGGHVWANLAISVLPDQDGKPANFLTMVQDVTDLHLLQKRFQHQALHDPLTDLPNRQYFRTRLETALANHPEDTLTVYHLALDGFELINDGLGHEAGEKLLRAVAHRLRQLVEGEDALVARFGGVEFAIVVRQRAQTPSIGEFAGMINRALAEPVYVDQHGVTTSACIGVVQRQAAGSDPADLLWAADVALRRAERTGSRQWALFDPDRGSEERVEAKLAAVLAGGLELGEMDIVYRPLVSLESGELLELEAQLLWETGVHDTVEHSDCLRLAEKSGAALVVRDWVLRQVREQQRDWQQSGEPVPVTVALSENQARDPDLVAAARQVLAWDDIGPGWLRLLLPVTVLETGDEEARENLALLGELGLRTGLHGLRGAAAELRLLRELEVDTVRLAEDLVQAVHSAESTEAPEVRAVHAFVPLLQQCGAQVWVSGVHTEQQAQVWRQLGCAVAAGPAFGDPVLSFDVPDLLARSTSAN
jgi:diguanylate cyclase (GGDEF)-like protein/PAS domain S-box-containing protein